MVSQYDPMSTGLILGLSLLALAVLWVGVEIRTLQDGIPGNHITATVRRAWAREPGPFFLFALALGFLMGHLFWCACP